MSAPLSDTSPPAASVPVGISTKVGLGTFGLASVIGLVQAVLDGDHTVGTILALAMAAIALVTTLVGRFAQAYAAYRDAPGGGTAAVYAALDELAGVVEDLREEASTVVDPDDYPEIDPADERRELHEHPET